MGEEEKKPADEKKPEKPVEEKKEEGNKEKKEDNKENNNNEGEATKEEKEKPPPPPPPPPPQEIVLKVYMHCEGCARKVRRCLKGFQGVEDVITDCKTSKVIVKGEKADPMKVLERVQRKSHRQVELISPIPKPPSDQDKKPPEEEKPKPEEIKKEETPVVTVVLKVYMHCEACAQEIKKRILRMKGVESAEPDLKSSQVTVKGGLDPAKLVEYVYKRTGKQAVIVKQDPDTTTKEDKSEKKDENKAETEKSGGGGGGGGEAVSNPDNQEKNDKKKEEGGEQQNDDKNDKNDNKEAVVVTEENKVVEFKINEFNYYPPRFAMELYAYNTYPPQIFSDENPNACSVM